MKYKLFGLFFVVLFAFVFIPITNGATQDNGGGIYYDTVTGRYCENSSGCPMDSATDIDEARAIRQAAIDAEFDRKYAAAGGTPITPTGVVPANQCISGTMTGSIYSDGTGQCSAFINGRNQTISYCTGKETTGACRPDRINATAAANAALKLSMRTGQSCTAKLVGFPGVDPNTGLGYYYFSDCGGDGGSGGGSAGGSTLPGSSSQGTAGSAGSFSSWATNTLNIIRGMISTAQSTLASRTPGQITAGAVPSTVLNTVAPVSTVSNSRIQDIISQANVLLYSSLSASEQTALTNYLTINRSALLDQNFQTFAPGSVFAWALSMGTSTTLNDLARSLGFTNLNPTNPDPAMWRFVKTPSASTPTPVSTPTNANICCSYTGWYECGGSIPNNPSPTLTPYYVNGVSTLGTRQCGVQPTATTTPVGTQPTRQIQPYPDTALPTISFPATITVTAELLRIRTEPNTQSRQINSFQRRATFTALNIVPGENVEGNNQWFSFIYGTMPAYVWSGGTAQSPIAPATINFPVNVIVISTLPLNVRNAPGTDAVPITQFQNGDTFSAGNIVEGESVEGNNKWWVFLRGSVPVYVWSGGAAVVH